MSRHNRKVPTSFYHRFALDTCAVADVYARGRVVSVLEGGYSDRALSSGAMAHICGLVGDTVQVDERWWDLENLIKVFQLAIRLSVLYSSFVVARKSHQGP
jgi:histone deacetylase HOS3